MKKNILNFLSPLFFSILFLSACQSSTTNNNNNNEEIDYQSITNENSEEIVTPPHLETQQDSILSELMGKDVIVLIETNVGIIKVKLYNETPLHKANFIKLCHNNFYNDIIFHRVISNFMIQAGDPNSKAAVPGEMYGNGGPGYTIPAEIVPHLRHKKGALAAARLGDMQNPRKESSGSQFYICHVETPSLDNQYTVFGETVKGMEVVDKIANLKRDPNDRPLEDVRIISTKLIY